MAQHPPPPAHPQGLPQSHRPPVLLAGADGTAEVKGQHPVAIPGASVFQAALCIPPVTTVLPGQVAGEGGEEVEEDVGDDHVVVDGHQAYDEQHGRTGTWGRGGTASPLG